MANGASFSKIKPRQLSAAYFTINPYGLLLVLNFGKFLVEAIDTAIVGNESLLPGVERMAIRASINLDIFHGRSSFECGAAADAGHCALVVLRMDVFLHKLLLSPCDVLPQREHAYYTRNPFGVQRLLLLFFVFQGFFLGG
jgi:hypothetical protein